MGKSRLVVTKESQVRVPVARKHGPKRLLNLFVIYARTADGLLGGQEG